MVKFFCDRCGVEVENLDALLELAVDITERPNRLVWNWRAEVCRECLDALKDEINARIVAPPVVEESKRKSARRAVS